MIELLEPITTFKKSKGFSDKLLEKINSIKAQNNNEIKSIDKLIMSTTESIKDDNLKKFLIDLNQLN